MGFTAVVDVNDHRKLAVVSSAGGLQRLNTEKK